MEQFTLKELVKRKLDETYIIIYAIKNEVNIKKAEIIEKTDVYTFIGIDIKGNRQFINMYQDKPLNKHFWLDCFEGLKSRGLKNILFLSVDDNKNIKRTAKISFPDIIFVDSLTDIAPKFYKYTSERSSKNVVGKIRALYTQKTITEYKETFKIFKTTYNNVIHQKLIEKYLNNIESIYKYSYNIRLLIFKHSANMEFYDRIRISFNQNNQYILEIDEIYNKLKEKTKISIAIIFEKCKNSEEVITCAKELIEKRIQIEYLGKILKYLYGNLENPKINDLIEEIINIKEEKEVKKVSTIRERLKAEYVGEYNKGVSQTWIEAIKKLVQKNMTNAFIKDVTGYKEEEIEKIRKKINAKQKDEKPEKT